MRTIDTLNTYLGLPDELIVKSRLRQFKMLLIKLIAIVILINKFKIDYAIFLPLMEG